MRLIHWARLFNALYAKPVAITRINPADAAAYGDRAICYYQLRRYREALQDAQECTKMDGTPNPELVHLLTLTK
jgi:Tetratricopeptide repeat.